MFLYLHRMVTGKSFAELALDFDIDPSTAERTFKDILMYQVMFSAYIPTVWDDQNATDEEIESHLEAISDSQSPGIKRVQNCFRTPDGRRPVAVNLDATHLGTQNSGDPGFQFDHYSGPRGKGHCELGAAITCGKGSVIAVTPGLKISATPRGGDSSTLASELGQSDRSSSNCGFPRLFRGTPKIGVLLVTDRGYIYIPHNVSLGDNPTPEQWCRDNNVQFIWPFKVGE